MALFKIKRGLKANLPKTYVEGYCYVTTDDGKFYIDTSNDETGRIVLNAAKADTANTWTTARKISISGTAGTTGTNIDGSAAATLVIPTTVKGFSELGTSNISSSAALYIAPGSTLYLKSGSSSSLIFMPRGTERARFDPSGNFLIKTAMYPGTNNTYNLGTSDYKWKNVYATAFIGDLSGNALTATKLATARTINGVSFDGSKNISFQGSYVSNTEVNSLPAGLSYIEMPATATVSGDPTYGAMLSVFCSANRAFQIAGNSSNELYFRGIHSSSLTSDAGTGYGSWQRILTGSNYTSYTVTKTGGGASGTWGINISGSSGSCTGNAATATKADKLTTARTFTTNLASTTAGSFDGSANVTVGVSGTLPVANGGTGNTAMTANRLVWSESATKLTAGNHYASSAKVAINSTSAPTETFYVNGTAKINGALTATSLNLTTIEKTMSLSTQNTWYDTGIVGSNLATGTYIIQISRVDSNKTEYWSGIMSWCSTADSSPNATEGYDEIVLHNAGEYPGSVSHIMARTVRTTSGTKLQLCVSGTTMGSSKITFKCAKVI